MTILQDCDVLTVSELTQAIKLKLESEFPRVQLKGEISNFKQQSSGHLYFSLKDQHAQISAVMFRGNAGRLKNIPKDGDQVMITGEVNVYPQGGRYQMIVRDIRQMGLGDLLLKLEELKQKLHLLGWFSNKHKKELPKFPKKIGVITSPTGAVIQDIINVLSRRFSGFHLILYPVKVQGDGAASEIAMAIEEMNKFNLVDVLIVGRGGGSIEDLWAFNEEIVAEAIFNSQIPIISAVGHETDHCIADYVADVRAPTPSAAAEIVVAEKDLQLKHLKQVKQRLTQSTTHILRHARHRLDSILKQPVFTPYTLLGPWIQKSDDLRNQIDIALKSLMRSKHQILMARRQHVNALNPTKIVKSKLMDWQRTLNQTLKSRLINSKQKFSPSVKRSQLDQVWKRQLSLHRERLDQLTKAIRLIDPKHLLKRGYSILISEKDKVITSVKDVKKGEKLSAIVSDGKINNIYIGEKQ